jgi:hypothetical protein
MTMIAPGKYSATIQLVPNAPYEYKFNNGVAPTFEVLNSSFPCTNGNAQYTNRTLALAGADTTICSTWSSCNSCGTLPPALVNVTLQVSSPDSTPVHVQGSWNWGIFPGAPMTMIAPGKYSATIQLVPNAPYEYKFNNGVAPTFETLNPSFPCTNGNAQYTNRTLALAGADTTICSTWSSCANCNVVPPANISVKFAVESPDSLPVYVFGNWSNWSNFPGDAMTLNPATGAYEKTLSLLAGSSIEYLFVSGVQNKEQMNPADPCTNGNPQYTNRVKALGTAATTLCNIWESCAPCGVGTNDPAANNMEVQVSTEFIKVIAANNIQKIDAVYVYDLLGKRIFAKTGNVPSNTKIPVQLFTNNLYIVQVISGNNSFKIKTCVQ